jgi:hypothetical protein
MAPGTRTRGGRTTALAVGLGAAAMLGALAHGTQAMATTECPALSGGRTKTITFSNHLHVPVRLTATIPNCTEWGTPNPSAYALTIPAASSAHMRVNVTLLGAWTQRFIVPIGKNSTGTMEHRAFPVNFKVKSKFSDMYTYHWAIEPAPRGSICATCTPITRVPIAKVGTFPGGTINVNPVAWTINLNP